MALNGEKQSIVFISYVRKALAAIGQLWRVLVSKAAEHNCFALSLPAPAILTPTTVWSSNATTVAGSAAATAGSGSSSLNTNQGIQIVGNNTLYIADKTNHRVVVIQPNSTNATAVLGTGSAAAGAHQFNQPTDVFVTSTSIYVLDTGNYRVQMWPRNGSNSSTVAGITGSAGTSASLTTFGLSYGIFLDNYAYLYVSDTANDRILRFPPNSTSGTSAVVVAGTGTGGAGASQLNGPYRIFVDDDQNIYIADTLNHRIQMWVYGACSGVTVAGTGTSGTTDSQLSSPTSVIIDANQYMYVADQSNNRIQRWAPGACSGQCLVGCSRLTGAGSNLLNNPQSVVFDSQGALYVSDGSQHRVQKFAISSNNGKNCVIRWVSVSSSVVSAQTTVTVSLTKAPTTWMNTMSTPQIMTSGKSVGNSENRFPIVSLLSVTYLCGCFRNAEHCIRLSLGT